MRTGNVLSNDTNGGQGTLSVQSSGPLSPSVGTLVIESDGDYTFTPAANYFGTATTSYVATNGDKTKAGAITINVVEHRGRADRQRRRRHGQRGPGDGCHEPAARQRHRPRRRHADGHVRVQRGRRRRRPERDDGHLHAAADVCGDDLATFDYAISDGNGGTDSASATVDITCVNDDPVAVDDNASGTEDSDVMIPASDLAENDTDEDSDTAT